MAIAPATRDKELPNPCAYIFISRSQPERSNNYIAAKFTCTLLHINDKGRNKIKINIETLLRINVKGHNKKDF